MLCLTRSTDPRWAALALADLPALLADHAHCEMKAASNALSLATRWPASPRVARALVALAEEELRHFNAVLGELEERAIPLGKPEMDGYVTALRKLAAATESAPPRRAPDPDGRAQGAWYLGGRLLVGALIEARSCERFRLLADALRERGEGLASLYEDLFAAEAGHYATLVELAIESVGEEAAVRVRLAELAVAEGALAATLGRRPTMHG